MDNYDFTYTGAEIQAILDTGKKLKDSGYIFLGVATPSTNPGTPTQKVYYEAKQAGTYTNFGGVVLPDGISLLKWNGSWTSETVMCGDGGVFDISVYKSSGGTLAKYTDLAAALGTHGANIPQSLRKGGMSVKFVQSSDNKYVQYRLMVDSWSTNPEDWAIADEGVYVENPEFVYVKTDKDDKILWAIKTNGNIYYGAGVPQQVVDYINEKIAELSLDEYEDIVAFLNDLEKGDKTLQTLLNEKVDKEEGKSLIDVEYANGVHYVENPEFVIVVTDNEDRILYAVKADGDFYFGAGVPQQIIDYVIEHTDATKEELLAIIDTKVDKEEGKSLISAEFAGGISYVENPEFAGVWLDNEERILFGVQTDGNFLFGCGVPQQVKEYIEQKIEELPLDEYESIVNFIGEYLGSTDLATLLGQKVDKEEGKSLIDEDVAASQSVIEDPEGRLEIATDSEDKIISYRRDSGTLVENVGIETPNITAENISAKEVNIEGGEATLEKATLNSLELTNEGMNEFQQALKDAGFQPGGAGDWSDYISNDGDNPLCIPEPRCAMINVTNLAGNFVWPTSKPGRSDYQKGINADKEAIFEFCDMQGNYFKKTINISAQGNSSMAYPKKNAGFDLFDSEYDGDAFSVRFGNWPAMDSYHLKAYYTDFFKGAAISAYKLAMEIDNTYPIIKNRNWKRALLKDYNFGTCTADGEQLSDLSLQVDTGALCMPDGFPCIVYVNGAFYGIYSFNIKKDRANYHMKKNNPKHIHLDGTLNGDTIFINPNNPSHNTISWGAFEIRNPKNLVYATSQSYTEDGETKTTYKYDADIKQAEIAGNADGSDTYDTWIAGSYSADKIVKHNGHYFINTIEGNDKEPLYNSSKNADDSPDFKNKTGCGWLNCTNTIKVKNSIIQFSKYWKEIQDKSGAEARKEELEKHFDVENQIDYYIVQLVTGDADGFSKNWQWTTWDGSSWYVNEYDKDMVFGANFTGNFTFPPCMSWNVYDYRFSGFSNLTSSYVGMMGYIYNYYRTEIKERYKELRDKGIITISNILDKTVEWVNRVGNENFVKEYNKWSGSPCNTPPIVNEGWTMYAFETFNEYRSIADYDSETTYNEGDKCKYGYLVFVATTTVQGVAPAARISHCDNVYRLSNWINERIALEDDYLEYNV